MSYSIQPNGDFIIDKMKSNNNDEVIIHESEVQDIINMMKEDLHLEKFNTIIIIKDLSTMRLHYPISDRIQAGENMFKNYSAITSASYSSCIYEFQLSKF